MLIPNERKLTHFTDRYSVQKTMRMKLIPIGKTMLYFQEKQLLENDEKLSEDYRKVKLMIDRFHRNFIENVLNKTKLSKLKEYAEIYYHCESETDRKNLDEIALALRKEICNQFKNEDVYGKLFSKKMITEVLPEYLDNDEEKEIVKSLRNFTTYFTGFFTNRKNMYSEGGESTAIAYRCVDENFPKHLDNIKAFEKAVSKLSTDDLDALNADYQGVYSTRLSDVFTIDYFNLVLSQSGIDRYNEIVGGYTKDNGQKVKGINEYINLYNQKAEKKDRIPMLKPLYKQILSESEKGSFIPTEFKEDDEVLSAILDLYINDKSLDDKPLQTAIAEMKTLLSKLDEFSLEGVFIKNDVSLTDLSNGMFGSWAVIRDLWNENYDSVNLNEKVKNIEKYEVKRKKAYKSEKYFSLALLQELISSAENDEIRNHTVADYYKTGITQAVENISARYDEVGSLLNGENIGRKGLKNDDESVALIKKFLDSIKELERLVKPLSETNVAGTKNDLFYSQFTPLFDNIRRIDRLYDKVRNYVTQKPFSTDKIKLNFGNSQLLNGWDKNKEKDCGAILLCKDEKYYLAIIDKSNNRIFENIDFPDCDEDCYKKAVYKLLPGPNKMLPKVFFAKANIEYFAPSDEILTLYKNGTFKKGDKFNLDDCHKLIDFYKASIAKHSDWSAFGFKFKNTDEYNDISEFYRDVTNQGYKLSFTKIPTSFVDKLVDEGKIYLFQLYNKDFSEHKKSKGTDNLHTMYFKMLFDEKNLDDVVYKLNGEAEIFYRPASIKYDKPTHPKNEPIKNKNELNDKKTSVFTYDLIKDKRYTEWQFSLHFPITMNFKAPNALKINEDVRRLLKDCDNNYVIGIDRGERNLLYVSVIDSSGTIAEQRSLNLIRNEHNGKTYSTDYQEKLAKREVARKEQRQNWKTIESIKELKEGYISQAVHIICQLVVKYDAIIVMENLNDGFKRGRTKFEKQVYHKFEKMLIDKLNYYVDKKKDPEEEGGLLHAYQLTNKFETFQKLGRQSGFIFYIPPYLTSKVDPVTGFANLLYPRYENVEKAKDLISKFDAVKYNSDEDYFEFYIDYGKFPKGTVDYRRKWTVCTYGERIIPFRDPDENNSWKYKTVKLTEEFKSLFNDYSIDLSRNDLKSDILAQTKGMFFEKFIYLLKLTLQLRNSDSETQDYIISPVKDKNGRFYYSSDYDENSQLPCDADANGAYNIARKGLWIIEQLKQSDDVSKTKFEMSNAEWLKFIQENDMDERNPDNNFKS